MANPTDSKSDPQSSPTTDPNANSANDSASDSAGDPPHIRVGCLGLPSGLRWDRYWEKVDFIERSETYFDLPKAAKLRKWAEATPPHAGLSLVASQLITERPGNRGYQHQPRTLDAATLAEAGGLRDTRVVRAEVDRLVAATQILTPDVVVFRTSAQFSPSGTNQDRLRAFFGDLAPAERFGTTRRAWHPQGIWEPDEAAALAGELGLLYVCNPLTKDPIGHPAGFFENLPSDDAYFHLTGLGSHRRRFETWDLESLLELADEYQRVWLVFANVDQFRDAGAMRKLVRAAAPPDSPAPPHSPAPPNEPSSV